MHEDQGGAFPQTVPISKVASSYTEAEFAKWTTRSTWSRSKKITKAYREVTGKPAAATLTIEYQAYLILQSNNRTRIEKKRSKSWFSSSRITRTRSLSCRTCLSIPGYVIKKNFTHGAKHGASERQRMFYKAWEMFQKARQPKHGGTKPFWKYGTRTTNTASPCQKLGALKSTSFSMTNLHWKITPLLQQEGKRS